MARWKSFKLRRKLSLLVFLFLLWIYRSLGRRTRNSESSGMANRTEGMYATSTRGYGSILDSHLTIPDAGDDSPYPRTIAAILPVTTSVLPHLSESLATLSTFPHLSEVHLLCPEDITGVARNSLRQSLSRLQGSGNIEFFVTRWRHEWSEAESALRVAANILSNDVLVLPQDALARVDPIFQRILFAASSLLPVPLGLSGSEISCETKYQGFLGARFVLPPLLLPSRLGTTNHSYFHLTSWQELGAHFARVEGMGGVVPHEALESTDNCQDSNASETVTVDVGRFPSEPPESSDLLVVLVAERGDMPALSKLACKFKHRGTEVNVIAYAPPPDSIDPPDPANDCDIVFTHVQDLHDLALHHLPGHSSGVFLTLSEYRFPLESLLGSNAWGVAIQIPRSDLPHCDWMASLGIQDLQSKHPSYTFEFFPG